MARSELRDSREGDILLGVMCAGDLPGVILPGVLAPRASYSRSGAYATYTKSVKS